MTKYSEWTSKHLDVRSQMGNEWLVMCPFHENARTPSCCINVSKGLFVCYSCGEKGTLQVMADRIRKPLTAHYSTGDLRGQLAQFDKVVEVKVYSADFLDRFKSGQPHRYWLQRGLSRQTIKDWQLGYDAQADAVTIPIRSVKGEVLGVVRRLTHNPKQGPRYLYPKGFKISWHLFGAHMADKVENKGKLVITEGAIDCLAMWEAGQPAVALLGAQLHPHQLTLLSSLGYDDLVLFLDRDEAGIHGTLKAAAMLVAEGYNVSVAQYPDDSSGKDPDSLLRDERVRAVKRARSYMGLRIEDLRATLHTAIPRRTPRISGPIKLRITTR